MPTRALEPLRLTRRGGPPPKLSFVWLAPSLVAGLGIAVAAIIAWLGVTQLREQSDAATALRAEVLASALSERLRATAAEDRTFVIERASRRCGSELLLVEQDGRIVVDGSLAAPSRAELVRFLVAGVGETQTRLGRTRFHAAPLGYPSEHLSLLVFVPAPERPYATSSLLTSVAALTLILIGVASLVAYAFARYVREDVVYVTEQIVEMAAQDANPSGKPIPVRDLDQVGLLTSAHNVLVQRFEAAEHAYRQDLSGALAYDKDRSGFLAALSHELRTPLNAILGFADVLLSEVDGPLSPDALENVTVLKRSAEHLRDLINDILDLSALESGELALDRSAVDVHAIAAEVVREARVAAQSKPLTVSLSGEPARAWADPRRVRQIIGNIVSNAVKFTREGFVHIQVKLDGEAVSVQVSDSGPGIAAEHQSAIFEEYRQAEISSRESRAGAGLGLAITRRLVRMHGGRIELESEVGKGSRFTVWLPTRPVTTSEKRFISTLPPPPSVIAGRLP